MDDGASEPDGAEGFRLTRQGSGDSTDSAPGEFPEETYSNLEEEIRKKVKCADNEHKKSSLSGSGGGSTVGEETESASLDSFSTTGAESSGTLKRKPRPGARDDELESCTTDSGTYEQHTVISTSHADGAEVLSGVGCSSSSSGSISSGIVASVSSSDTGASRTMCDGSANNIDLRSPSSKTIDVTDVTNINEHLYSDAVSVGNTSVRNTAEIRNNIPNVNEVRHDSTVSQQINNSTSDLSGVVPKSRKKSPGLAQRLVSSDSMAVRNGSSASGMPSNMVPSMVPRGPVVSGSINNASSMSYGSTAIDTSVVSAQQSFEAHLKINGGMSGMHGGMPNNSNTSFNNVNPSSSNHPSHLTNTAVPINPNMTPYLTNYPSHVGANATGVVHSRDVENEYDYVKYSRIQPQGLVQGLPHTAGQSSGQPQNQMPGGSQGPSQGSQGDMYVGMRLAYSDSNDSLHSRQVTTPHDPQHDHRSIMDQQLSAQQQSNIMHNQSRNAASLNTSQLQQLEQHLKQQITSSQESSPEKSHMMHYQAQRNLTNSELQQIAQVSEDTLTEIPLNGGNYINVDNQLGLSSKRNLVPEEKHEFSLSPEATECDSAEVESVSSVDGDGKSLNGMPAVEDGLSSSGSSDVEEDNHPQIPMGGNHNLLRQLGLESSASTPAVLPVEQQVRNVFL